jgi:hypothetical protein
MIQQIMPKTRWDSVFLVVAVSDSLAQCFVTPPFQGGDILTFQQDR